MTMLRKVASAVVAPFAVAALALGMPAAASAEVPQQDDATLELELAASLEATIEGRLAEDGLDLDAIVDVTLDGEIIIDVDLDGTVEEIDPAAEEKLEADLEADIEAEVLAFREVGLEDLLNLFIFLFVGVDVTADVDLATEAGELEVDVTADSALLTVIDLRF